MAALRISPDYDIEKIVIVGDESTDVHISEWEVKAAGFKPIAVNRSFEKIEELTAFFRKRHKGRCAVIG